MLTEEQRAKHRERMRKKRAERREEYNEYARKCRAKNREEYREYRAKNLNSRGVKKSIIRNLSGQYLSARHSKLDGYEIHHCFGYDDYKKFIYIPKELHLQIHQFLRDHNIPAESNHWMAIRDLVNSSGQYTYISGGIV